MLVVGGGGREHAICLGLDNSASVGSIHAAPGNAGTSMVGTNHPVSASDVGGLVALASELSADLVVVGPEAPLVDGLADSLRAAGIACFGPHSVALCSALTGMPKTRPLMSFTPVSPAFSAIVARAVGLDGDTVGPKAEEALRILMPSNARCFSQGTPH